MRGPHSQADSEATWGSGDAHVQSTATRRPRPQAIGAHGRPYLTFGCASKPSPSAPWARGLLSVFWERGSPDLPACGLQRGSTSGPVWPIFINSSSRPSRGAKPCGADDARPPQGRPRQAGSRRGREIKARGASRGVHNPSHDDQDQAGASLRSVLVSSLLQRGQAQAWSTEASGKGFHIGATRPRPAGQQDGGHRGAQDSVIASSFGSRRPTLVRITCTRCSPSKMAVVGALPAQYLGRGPGPL